MIQVISEIQKVICNGIEAVAKVTHHHCTTNGIIENPAQALFPARRVSWYGIIRVDWYIKRWNTITDGHEWH